MQGLEICCLALLQCDAQSLVEDTPTKRMTSSLKHCSFNDGHEIPNNKKNIDLILKSNIIWVNITVLLDTLKKTFKQSKVQ